jgi:hypothetical protein
MPFVFLMLGVLIVVVAYNDAAGNLWNALKQDIPGYFIWALALGIVAGIGFIPGMQKPSRYLLGLVFLVLILKNGTGIVAGLQQFAGTGAASTSTGTNPTAPGVAVLGNPQAPSVPSASVTGTTPPSPPPPPPPPNWLDPNTYLNMYSPSVGFGGAADTHNTQPVSQPTGAA